MSIFRKKNSEKGETNSYYIIVGVLLTICVIAAAKYFHDRNNDVEIHVPHVEVH